MVQREVGCPHSSEEVGNAHGAKGDMQETVRWQRQPHAEVERWRPQESSG